MNEELGKEFFLCISALFLLLAPGFVTDAIAFALLLPNTQALGIARTFEFIKGGWGRE